MQSYQQMRNALVTQYRRQPERRLGAEEACEALGQFDPAALKR